MRYETRGPGPKVKFSAAELWATKEIFFEINLSDLSRLPWLTEGNVRNQTSWLDSEEVDMVARHQERGVLTRRELEELGVGNFCLRFTVLPVKVDVAMLYGGLVPLSKDQLSEKMDKFGVEMDSGCIPTISIKLGNVRGKLQNGMALSLKTLPRAGVCGW